MSALIREYLQGSIVVSDVHFRNELTKVAVDPENVTFFYQPNGETPSATLTFAGATTPAVGVIAKMGIGWYRTYIDTTLFIGLTGEFWDGEGVNQAPGQRQFLVKATGDFT